MNEQGVCLVCQSRRSWWLRVAILAGLFHLAVLLVCWYYQDRLVNSLCRAQSVKLSDINPREDPVVYHAVSSMQVLCGVTRALQLQMQVRVPTVRDFVMGIDRFRAQSRYFAPLYYLADQVEKIKQRIYSCVVLRFLVPVLNPSRIAM